MLQPKWYVEQGSRQMLIVGALGPLVQWFSCLFSYWIAALKDSGILSVETRLTYRRASLSLRHGMAAEPSAKWQIKFTPLSMMRPSFLMVLIPILGASLLEVKDYAEDPSLHSLELSALLVGFIAAFVSGFIACKWMIKIVKKGKLTYFAIYCFIVGTIAIISSI